MVLDKKITLLHILLLSVVAIIVTLPAIIYGFPKITDDAAYHAMWASLFSKQMWAGDIYPRWLAEMNAGLGSPVFFYYPPLPYFITSLLRPLFPNDPFAWGQLGISASLSIVLSGLGMYVWLRRIAGPNPAVVGAMLYMIMPYHLAVDLYTRGAFAELWAFVWMPLILFLTIEVINRRPSSEVALALCYAALATTHLLTTLMFFVIPIAYGFYKADARERKSAGLRVIAAMTLGTGLAAIFLVPAMTTQDYVFIGSLTESFSHYGNWFLFAKLKLWGDETSKLSVMLLFVLIPAAAAFFLAYANRVVRKELFFWLVVSLASVFMMTPLSRPVWQIIPPLQMLQFPYRFNTILSLGVTAIFTLGIASLRRPVNVRTRFVLAAMVAFAGVWLFATALAAKSAFPNFTSLPEAMAKLDKQLDLHEEVWEYWPRETSRANHELLLEKVRSGELSPQARVVEGTGTITVTAWQPRDILLQAELTEDCTLHVNQLYFPGWSARVVQSREQLNVTPSNPDGLLSIRAPRGSQQISIRMETSMPERAGQLISALSAATILLLIVMAAIKRRAKPVSTANENHSNKS